ncbi:hypothetical protein [Paenibacillus elgii]|uniref:hypothetical protein n=1 Tax=Paenibacillus elgii TaxID=189691 RepID=UPI000FDA653A|nr:hypothetical protein [Paenibacillus elgii]NEN87132.1 hypothetical protein [Paenibacillus elgii]
MLQLIRVIWALVILVNLSAVMWFILGTTANFQRGIDLVSTVVLVYFGIPSILLIILSIILLFKRWPSSSSWSIIGVFIIIICMLSLSSILFKNVNTSGWLTENITTDTLQTTADGQYEYQLELINLFQKNSYARLYLKNVSTGEEIRIPLEIPVTNIRGLSEGKVNYWIALEATSKRDVFILYTTSKFPLPNEKYEIDVKIGKAMKVQ